MADEILPETLTERDRWSAIRRALFDMQRRQHEAIDREHEALRQQLQVLAIELGEEAKP